VRTILGHPGEPTTPPQVAGGAIANVLKREDLEPASDQGRRTSWSVLLFVTAHSKQMGCGSAAFY